MSLGLGIFLSTLLVSVMYSLSRYLDKGRLKKLVKILVAISGLLALALLLLLCYDKYEDYKYKKPYKVTEYWDVKLGEPLADTRFTKGSPNKEFEFHISSLNNFDSGRVDIINDKGYSSTLPLKYLREFLNSKKYKISNEALIKTEPDLTFKAWEYSEDSNKSYSKYSVSSMMKHFVRFAKNNTVGAVSCAGGESSYSCPHIASVGINTSWDELIEIFGSPPYGYTDFDDGSRAVCYPQYNVCFTLKKSEVRFITVKSWEAEDYYRLGKALANIYGIGFTNTYKKDNNAYAMKAFGYAIDLGYKSADLYNSLGLVLEKLNKKREAIEAFDNALKFDPRYASAYSNKSRLFFDDQKYEEAIASIDKAIDLSENNFWRSWNLRDKAWYLIKSNKYEEAVKACDRSIAASDIPFNDSYCYHTKGLALLGLKKRKEAIEAINKAIELNPEEKEFQETLRALYLD